MKTLQFRELDFLAGNKVENLVVFLHGYGSNQDDLIGLSEEFNSAVNGAHFISVDAPFEFEMVPGMGYQWFSLREGVTEEEILEKVLEGNEILDNFLAEQLKRFGLTRKNLILVGFSQGAMMSLHNSMRADEDTKAVVAFSGKIINDGNLIEETRSLPRICLIHGTHDDVVPFENLAESTEVLNDLEIQFDAYSINGMGHSINFEALENALGFLNKID